MTRCPVCYRRLDTQHEVLGRCPTAGTDRIPTVRAGRGSQRGYVPPSRAHRVPREEWLEAVRVTPEERRAASRETSRRHREKKRAARTRQPE